MNDQELHLIVKLLSVGLVDADPNTLHHIKEYRDLRGSSTWERKYHPDDYTRLPSSSLTLIAKTWEQWFSFTLATGSSRKHVTWQRLLSSQTLKWLKRLDSFSWNDVWNIWTVWNLKDSGGTDLEKKYDLQYTLKNKGFESGFLQQSHRRTIFGFLKHFSVKSS